jgi:LPXTG-site transpeptidase (sortase) family protein
LVTQNAPNVTQVIQQNAAGKSFALSIPSIGITNLTVTHPTNVTTQKGVLDVLKNGVGHLFSFPGDGGKILVYGHSSSYPWDVSPYTKIFRGINKVNIGDLITVVYEGKTIQYQVSQKKTVLAKDRSEFEPDSNGEELILYTCWPPDSITHRFLVIARPVERVAGR